MPGWVGSGGHPVARRGPSKTADSEDAQARLRAARDFHRDAQELHELRVAQDNANGTITLIINAAIAYADALTAHFGGFINQQDHRAVIKAIQSALGRRAEPTQLERLRRIIDEKDAAAYGIRRFTHQRASDMLGQLDRFAQWVEQELQT